MPAPPLLVLVALGVVGGLLAADEGPVAVACLAAAGAATLLAPRGTRRAAARPFALAALLGAAAGLRARAPPRGDGLARRLPDARARLGLEGAVLSAEPP